MMKLAKDIFSITKDTFKKFFEDDPLNHSASIAFYTIFSMPAVLIIMVEIAGNFFGEQAVRGELSLQMEHLMGAESSRAVQNIIENVVLYEAGIWGRIIGIGTLLFSATTVFVAIQTGLNAIWKVKPKPKKGWLKLIVDRVLSFTLVITMGFLLLVSLIIEAVLNIFSSYVRMIFTEDTFVVMYIIHLGISVAVVTLLFALIFKVLPDVKIMWKDVWVGALVTALLFILGRFLIGFYLGLSDVTTAYGAAGSLVLILLWVYYSSVILLLGAEFTQVYSHHTGRHIMPAKNAVKVVIQELGEQDVNEGW
jgi:membrane protein